MDSNELFEEFQSIKTESASITVSELDGLIEDYVAKRRVYEDAKKVASAKYAECEDAEKKAVEALKALGKKSYKLEGIGTFTRVMKEVVTVPKTLDAKRALFDWIKLRYDVDTLDTMLSINHQTLNSFYRAEAEKEKERPNFSIPGVDAPTSTETVSFRKAD